MDEFKPIAQSPVHHPEPTGRWNQWKVSLVDGEGPLTVSDVTPLPKWRKFGRTFEGVAYGTARHTDLGLVWSVSPGEWSVMGTAVPDDDPDAVDLTHVRAAFRLTGTGAVKVLEKVCSLDFGDGMFPSGRAARTLVGGVATEIVRDDVEDTPSYLLVPSRSFAAYLYDVLADAGSEIGLIEDRFPGAV